MHAITPIVLTGILLGAGCTALFCYCAYVFASVGRRLMRDTARNKRRKA